MSLHIYGQQFWHNPVYIVGDHFALASLHSAITRALDNFKVADGKGQSEFSVEAADGKGYFVHVQCVLDKKMKCLQTPYADPVRQARDPENAIKPWEI